MYVHIFLKRWLKQYNTFQINIQLAKNSNLKKGLLTSIQFLIGNLRERISKYVAHEENGINKT